jgi:hypothetical protein
MTSWELNDIAIGLFVLDVAERAIMNQTGHRSLSMVRRSIRDGELFRDENAARAAGL